MVASIKWKQIPPDKFFIFLEDAKIVRIKIEEFMRIERASFKYPWTKKDFLKCFTIENCVVAFAVFEKTTIGFAIVVFDEERMEILNFAVSPIYRRQGVGSEITKALINLADNVEVESIILKIATNDPAGLFFWRMGFDNVTILENHSQNLGKASV
ncbi:GNAT family N-acetyltransferase [Patescibacteria group bacterium]|nr:GNAT family N-acetyltransferase [Patescibacteria group bacterium]